nr:sulfatase-like hydrolase/transferase [Verrucomicrobium spinosum]
MDRRSHSAQKTPAMIRLFLLPAVLLFSTRLAGAEPPRQPNIVFFLVDDLGQRDLACYGSTFYETPHLDRLAKEGALFTDATPPARCARRAGPAF